MKTSKNPLEVVEKLLEDGQAKEALAAVNNIQDGSIRMQNFQAVCLMRLGEYRKAVVILTELVYRNNSIITRTDIPDGIRLNLVTAMLLAGNVSGAIGIIGEVKNASPMKEKLQQAITAWKKTQPIWSRLAMFMGMFPLNKPIKLDFQPGLLNVL
jgi:3-deoxy-D-arabino-heptulosonate 7-phosphate (DAHP) synthase